MSRTENMPLHSGFRVMLHLSPVQGHQLPSLSKSDKQLEEGLPLREAFIRGIEILHKNNWSKFGKIAIICINISFASEIEISGQID
jgi:hypothetical protein